MLKTLSKSLTSKNSTSQIIDQDKIAKILDGLTSDQSESALSEFELRFSNIYVGFFEKLLNEYPALSQNERRLCAFLKLSMTTKEIAAITGQSIRAIEIARTRLRKKIKLTNSEKNLYDFFVNY
jgi:DNA-binding CsgD family transcriptional regulator